MKEAIYVSLLLTLPTIAVSVLVIHIWKVKHLDDAKDWLLLGICLSFIGGIFDNAWWGVAWYLKYNNDPNYEWWFDHGVYSNIVFRQLSKLLAGYCHVRAAMIHKQARNINLVFFMLILSSLIVCVILL